MFVRAARQGLEGSALPVVDGDDLDVTSGSKPNPTIPSAPTSNQADSKAQNPITTLKAGSSGLGWVAKLFYISLIVAGCFIFIKSRKERTTSWREKSLA